MIDLGHPFSKPYKDIIDAFEERIRYGVEQPAQISFVFQAGVLSYELNRPAESISRVIGDVGGKAVIFEPGVHYRLTDNRLIWIHEAERPDEGSRLEVAYEYREWPAGLTDFNPGSVVGTLIRAASREMKLVYEQIDEAYRRAFIDHADGVALDNIVALLGIARNEATFSKGHVTFFKKKAPNQNFVIPVDTRITDESERVFTVAEAGVLSAISVDEFAIPDGGIVQTQNRVGDLLGIWLANDNPDDTTPLETSPVSDDFPFGEDERTIQLVDAALTENVRIRYIAKSVTVPVVAAEAGPDSNVNAGTITIMPTPPSGIEGVINEEPTVDGRPAEDDDQLRLRAKFHLERLGNATLNALKFAILEIAGIEGVTVIDHNSDPAIPLGEVHVSYSGGDEAEVRRIVEETRAAGIKPVYRRISPILITGTWFVIPSPGFPASLPSTLKTAFVDTLNALGIGESLSIKKLNALVYNITGAEEVAEAQLVADGNTVPDPFIVKPTELIRPAEDQLIVQVLTGLEVVGTPTRNIDNNEITTQCTTNAGVASFGTFTLDVTIAFRTRLKTAPDQPPFLIGTLGNKQLVFTGDSSAVLTITDDEVTGYIADDHETDVAITIISAAFPGLTAAVSQISLA